MAKLRVPQKAQRTLELLIALGHPRVRRALAPHGFGPAQLDEGWRRLRALAEATILLEPEPPGVRLTTALDAWENRWFPIVEVVLRSNHPRVHAVVFHELRQTAGAQVVVSVRTLLDRLDVITRPDAEGGLGDEGERARALLVERGLTDEVLAAARALLDRVGAPPDEDDESAAPDPEARAEAERRMWGWYLEWSAIARASITEPRLLASLGFQRAGRRRDE